MELNKKNIKKIQKYERKVIMELYAFTFDVMISIVCRYKKNEEDKMDLINTSFLKIIQNIHQFKIGSNYFSWVKTIVNNVVIDDFRKNENYKNLFVEDGEKHNEKPRNFSSAIDEQIDADALLEILNQLPPASKMVFNLYAIEGYTAKEVAQQLDIKYETVKWHVKEARKKLKQLILKENLTVD